MNDVMMHMNYADIIAVGVVLFWTLMGFRKGLSGQIAFFLSAVVVTTTAILGYEPCRTWLMQRFQMPFELARLTALVSVIVIPLIIVLAVHSVAGYVVKITFTAWIDRLGGALAAFVSSTTLVILVFVFLNVIPRELRPAATGEASYIGWHVIGLEHSLTNRIGCKIGNTRNLIQKARDERTGRREKWEQ